VESSKQDVPRANNENYQNNRSKQQTSKNLLARELH